MVTEKEYSSTSNVHIHSAAGKALLSAFALIRPTENKVRAVMSRLPSWSPLLR